MNNDSDNNNDNNYDVSLPDTDPAADDLAALFASALADEPESAVTPMTVLRAARAQQRTSRIRRWGGGGLAAAAAVAAVVVIGPAILPSGSSSNMADTAAMALSDSDDAAAGHAYDIDESADSAADEGEMSAEAAPQMDGDDSAADSASDSAADSAGEPDAAARSQVNSDEEADSAAADAGAADAVEQPVLKDTADGCVPFLSDGEVQALQRMLPRQLVIHPVAEQWCAPDVLRAADISVGGDDPQWQQATLRVIVSENGSDIPGPDFGIPDGWQASWTHHGDEALLVMASPELMEHLGPVGLSAVTDSLVKAN